MNDPDLMSMSMSTSSIMDTFDDDNTFQYDEFEASTSSVSQEASTSTGGRRILRSHSQATSTLGDNIRITQSDSQEGSTSTAARSVLQRDLEDATAIPNVQPRRRVSFDLSASNQPRMTTTRPSTLSEAIPPKRSKKVLQSENAKKLQQHLEHQELINLKQTQLLDLQIKRAEGALARDNVETQIMQINLEKAERLKQIEINKQKALAKLEIEAKRREYNLPHGILDSDDNIEID